MAASSFVEVLDRFEARVLPDPRPVVVRVPLSRKAWDRVCRVAVTRGRSVGEIVGGWVALFYEDDVEWAETAASEGLVP